MKKVISVMQTWQMVDAQGEGNNTTQMVDIIGWTNKTTVFCLTFIVYVDLVNEFFFSVWT